MAALKSQHPDLAGLLDWLQLLAQPSILTSSTDAERAWQEQQDALGTLMRVTQFPLSEIWAWKRPEDDHAPYLAGLQPEPVEAAPIEHDARVGPLPEVLQPTPSR